MSVCGAKPKAPWVFLVRCVDRSDRGHSFGLEPLGKSLSCCQFVGKKISVSFFSKFVSVLQKMYYDLKVDLLPLVLYFIILSP